MPLPETPNGIIVSLKNVVDLKVTGVLQIIREHDRLLIPLVACIEDSSDISFVCYDESMERNADMRSNADIGVMTQRRLTMCYSSTVALLNGRNGRLMWLSEVGGVGGGYRAPGKNFFKKFNSGIR